MDRHEFEQRRLAKKYKMGRALNRGAKYTLVAGEQAFLTHEGHDCFITIAGEPYMLLVVCKECERDHVSTIVIK